jgi:hypothetical protein
VVTEACEKREAKKEAFVERVYDALHKLVPEAEARGLRLGVENREAVEEIRLRAISGFCSTSSRRRWLPTGTIPGTPKSRKTSGYPAHDPSRIVWRIVWRDFICTMCRRPPGIIVRRGRE